MSAKRRARARRRSGFFTGRVKALLAIVLIAVIVVVAFQVIGKNSPAANSGPVRVLMVTSMGNITIELYADMPVTSGNFKNLAAQGVYDGTIFHRVVSGFVVQGGDATPKGINVPAIPDELPNKHSNVRGSVAMAKTNQPNSATSQFFIDLVNNNVDSANSTNLDPNYSVFGRVIYGMNVVDAIAQVQVDKYDKPLQDVTLIKAQVL